MYSILYEQQTSIKVTFQIISEEDYIPLFHCLVNIKNKIQIYQFYDSSILYIIKSDLHFVHMDSTYKNLI